MTQRSRLTYLALLALASILVSACSNDEASTSTTASSTVSSDANSNGNGNGTGTTNPGGGPGSTAATTTTVPEDNPFVQGEVVVEVEGATIVFDQRPYTLFDGSGTVRVIADDGTVLAEGPFEGDDSIMVQTADGSFQLLNSDGEVVAMMTQTQLNEAMAASAP